MIITCLDYESSSSPSSRSDFSAQSLLSRRRRRSRRNVCLRRVEYPRYLCDTHGYFPASAPPLPDSRIALRSDRPCNYRSYLASVPNRFRDEMIPRDDRASSSSTLHASVRLCSAFFLQAFRPALRGGKKEHADRKRRRDHPNLSAFGFSVGDPRRGLDRGKQWLNLLRFAKG